MNFKKSQSGRSMVEMLGVLAIIGVLSVGGIAGYSLSMRRHRANQMADAIAKYASLSYAQCQQQVLNGKRDSLTNCGSGDVPTYTDTDLGQLPVGVTYISHADITQNLTTGVDTVDTVVQFADKKTCQAVASIIESEGCDKDGFTHFFIKQN